MYDVGAKDEVVLGLGDMLFPSMFRIGAFRAMVLTLRLAMIVFLDLCFNTCR